MKKIYLILVSIFFFATIANAQLYSSSTVNLGFYSKTPVEDIEAKSGVALGVLNSKTNEVAFNVANTSFQFPNKLMQEHFNEKYIESEKYPNSTFKGKINEDVNLAKDGEYKVTVTGKLNIHGVEKDRTIPGTIIVKDNTITIKSDFTVKVVDHKIEIPKLVVAKIAEEIAVMINATLLAKK